MTRIRPMHNNLIVEEFELGEITKGGLLIPQIAKASTPYRYAKVLDVGPGRYSVNGQLIPVRPQIGDVVAFAKNQGVEFPLDNEQGEEKVYRLVNEQFVLGIVEGMPEQSALTGLDGRLLTMSPSSHARADLAYENLDRVARARRSEIIDSVGGTLEAMEDEEMES